MLENNWGDINSGYGSITLTVRGDSGPQATIEDVLIQNNLMMHTPNVFNILGKDTAQPSRRGRGLKIINNLFFDVDGKRWEGDGEFMKITDMLDVTIDHNTVIHTGSIIFAYGPANGGFVFTNNVMPHNSYGIIGQDRGSGADALRTYMPGALVRRNIIAGGGDGYPNFYPTDNFYPTKLDKVGFADIARGDYRLAPASAYRRKATNGKDVGCDIEALNAATAGVVRR